MLWEECYASESYLFGKESVLSLRDLVGNLRKGKALDIAMGEGRNSVSWLARASK